MEPLKPSFSPEDFKIAVPEALKAIPLAFRKDSSFRDDVLAEYDID